MTQEILQIGLISVLMIGGSMLGVWLNRESKKTQKELDDLLIKLKKVDKETWIDFFEMGLKHAIDHTCSFCDGKPYRIVDRQNSKGSPIACKYHYSITEKHGKKIQ